ncbi:MULTISPECIES: GNAT family N-acetyltransferase [unclassified Frankia]|uniref:GNAT family N-acetyltransferase n=1 Tax=unclassified Frankia TaxID=2632575 RepID=UPI001F3B4F93|nr:MULTISPECIES: GNAT family N-acetyltransferase [unclassified Frankia]
MGIPSRAPITVRHARGEDLPAALEVWQRANTARGRPPDVARVARVHAKLAAPDALLFVAEDGTEILGMLLAETGREDDGQGPELEELCHISMVFVDPGFWGQRMGESLLRALVDHARGSGYRRLQLWTGTTNRAAQRLYRRVGFVPSGRVARMRNGEEALHLSRPTR